MRILFRTLMLLGLVTTAWSYSFMTRSADPTTPIVWPNGPVPIQVKLGIPPLTDGSDYVAATQTAIQTWNTLVVASQLSPQVLAAGTASDGNELNEIVFSSDIFGQPFDANVLAITTTWTTGVNRAEADLIFNTAWSWSVYGGPNRGTPVDFRRVAIHELGHVLGLDHPDEAGQTVSALMNAYIGDVDTLTADDIAGIQALYGAPGVVPANDAFASAGTLTGNTAQAIGSNVGGSKEGGEPNHAGNADGHSSWWKWTAPGNGDLTVTTLGSAFDTILGAYTGAAVSALTAVASNDDVETGIIRTSSVTFSATGGTTYYFAVDGWDGDMGYIALNLNFTPAVENSLMRVTMVGLIDYMEEFGVYLPSKGVRRGDPFTISAIYDPTITSSPPGQAGMYPIDFSTTATISFSGLVYTMPGFRATVVNNMTVNGLGGLTTVDGHVLQGTVPASSDLYALEFTSILYSSNTNLVGNASSYELHLAQPSDYGYLCFFRLEGIDRTNPHPSNRLNISAPITYITVVPASTTPIAPSITEHPADQAPIEGHSAYFSVSASGVPSPVLQWQRLPAGTNGWDNLSDGGNYTGARANTLTVSGTTAAMSGDQFRCVVLSSSGGAASNAARLTVAGSVPVVVNHPVDKTVTVGQIAQFTVTITGNPVPSYQWQRQVSGTATWTNISDGSSFSGVTTATLTINATLAFQGDLFRCAAMNNQGAATSNPGRLIISTGVPGVIAAESGRSHTVFLGANGDLWGMGPNSFGELGLGSEVSNALTQRLITPSATGISTGDATSFYIKPDGTLWGTGFAGFGQFGNGTSPQSYRTPIQVASEVVQVAASGDFTMHLKRDQTLWASGRNNRGQLGTGDSGDKNTWELVGTDVTWVATGPEHTLFIKSDGSLWAMGNNSAGQLGDGTVTERHVPVPIATNVIKACAGAYFSYFIKSDNTLWGMGGNGAGQLGDDSTIERRAPVLIASNVVFVSAPPNGEHALFIKVDGSLWGMGGNGVGQLGIGSGTASSQVPVLIANNVVAASTGGAFSTFAKGDGSYWGMGRSTSEHELGFPGFVDYFLPMLISVGPIVGPGIPSNVAAADGASLSGVNVTWAPVLGAAYYEVWRHTSNDSVGATRIATNVAIPLHWDGTATAGTNYFYWIKAVNAAGTSSFSDGDAGSTRLLTPPVVTGQPSNATVLAGGNVIFTISVNGAPAPSLQWQRLPAGNGTWGVLSDGGYYSGVNSATLTITGATLAMSGDQFRCVATNGSGTATSNAATLTVTVPLPVITVQPSSQAVLTGAAVDFSVTVTSPVSVTYQWRKDGVDIPGATSATYSIASFQAGDVGSYTVVVTNGAGSVTSDAAALEVALPPVILTHPAAQTVLAGTPASFSVAVTSNTTPGYVWLKDGTPIPGATQATYTIASAQPADAVSYSVVVTNVAGSVQSSAATLTVQWPPVITQQPASQQAQAGSSATFSLTATGNPAPTGYQWQRLASGSGVWANLTDGTGYAGSTTPTLTAVNQPLGGNGDQFRCIVTNAVGTVTSNAATLTLVSSGSVAVAAGTSHGFTLQANGLLHGFGGNTTGQLGTGDTTPQSTPRAYERVFSVATSWDHSLYVRTDGTLWAMGGNANGQLGDGTTTARLSPTQVPGVTNVAVVAAGLAHSLFIRSDGTLWGMGGGAGGRLGDGTGLDRLSPVPIATEVIAATGGVNYTGYVRTDGSLWTMGNNGNGQLGDGTNSGRLSPVHVADNVATVVAHGYHLLFLKRDGTLWSTGMNLYGQLGDGANTSRNIPVQVASGVAAVSSGTYHSLYVKTDGTLWSVGYNASGQLGDGTTTNRNSPVQVATGVAAVAGGNDFSLFIKTDGSLWGMGSNLSGQLIGGGSASYATPVQLRSGPLFVPVAPVGVNATDGTMATSVGLTWSPVPGATRYEVWRNVTDNAAGSTLLTATVPYNRYEDAAAVPATVYHYWVKAASLAGASSFSVPDTGHAGSLPPAITGLSPARNVLTPGQSLTLSVTASGTGSLSYQWTHNGRPIAGATGADLPLSNVTYQDSGYYLVLITDANGTTRSAPIFVNVAPTSTQLITWGYLGQQQAGVPAILTDLIAITAGDEFAVGLKRDGSVVAWGRNLSNSTAVPSGLTDVVAISTGQLYTLALKKDGTVVAWGDGYAGVTAVPAGLSNVVAIAAGYQHCLALKSDGTVVRWGGIYDPTTAVPAGLNNVIAITAGFHSLALKSDGTVVAWGLNGAGQSTVPANLDTVVSIAAGAYHSLALKSDGTIIGWGRNVFGQVTMPEALVGVVGIAAGLDHSIAVKGDGTMVTWGDNYSGYAGIVPPPASGVTDAIVVSAGTRSTLVLRDTTNDSAPVVTIPPVNQTVAEDQTVVFSVTAAGPGPLTYQWRKNGSDMPGAISRTLTLPELTLAGAGSYDVVVTNHIGSTISAVANLIVNPVPVVTSLSPTRQVLVPGQALNLSVTATGTGSLGYQWTRNGHPLAGQTSSSLALASVTLQDSGWYVVRITDDFGTRRSPPIFITVAPARTQVRTWGGPNFDQSLVPDGLNDAIGVAAGSSHFMALKRDGTVVAWGLNANMDNDVRIVPAGLGDVVAVAAGDNYALALRSNGTVTAWGQTHFGAYEVPAGLADVVAVATGNTHSLALRSNGTVVAWGSTAFGALDVPAGLSEVVAISVGQNYSLALKADGTVVGWGYDFEGQTELGAGLNDIVAIEAGALHALALRADGTVVGAGYAAYSAVTPPAGLQNVAAIAAGSYHSIALKSDRTLAVWGGYYVGDPAPPADLTDVIAVSANCPPGYLFTIALRDTTNDVAPAITLQPVDQTLSAVANVTFTVTASGTPWMSYQWRRFGGNLSDGGNISGTRSATLMINGASVADAGTYDVVVTNAAGSATSRAATLMFGSFPAITNLSPRRQILSPGQNLLLEATATGPGPLSYQWTHNGRLMAGAVNSSLAIPSASYSDNGYYLLSVTGPGGTVKSEPIFVTVAPLVTQVRAWGANGSGQTECPAGLTDAISLAAGSSHSLALKRDGTVIAWGSGSAGQSSVPAGLTDIVAIAAGGDNSYALRSNGTLVGWGQYYYGVNDIPSSVKNVVSVAKGGSHVLALKSDGTVSAWGSNSFGQCNVPIGLADVVAIAAGGLHSLALKADGTVVAWGYNASGQSQVPAGLDGGTDVSAGANHSLMLKSDGTVAAWGTNYYGSTAAPPEFSGVRALAAGADLSVALKWDGTVVVGGYNGDGQATPPAGLTDVLAIAAGSYHVLAVRDASNDSVPVITSQPISQMIALGQNASFSVGVSGYPAPSFRWRKGGVNLSDGGNLSGATTATLTITGVQFADAGDYDVVVSNSVGSVTSSMAALTFTGNFDVWQLAKFDEAERLDANISGPNADPDHDGFANLVEYALGLEPKTASTTGLPGVSAEGPDWVYTYTRPDSITDVTYEVEVSTNLVNWSTAGVAHELVSASGGSETWRARYPLASAASCYFRLKVTQ